MKLIFEKDEEHQINVYTKQNGKKNDFSYIDMIKELIRSGKLEDPEIAEGFTASEIQSINSMVKFINEEISRFNTPGNTL